VWPQPESAIIFDQLYGLKVTPDGGFIAVGQHMDENDPEQHQDTWILKLDACGDVEWQGCEAVIGVDEKEPTSLFEAYPNPAHDFVEVNLGEMALTPEARMEVRDVLGALVYKQEIAQGESHLLLQLDELLPGMYFVSLIDKNQELETQQIILK